MKTSKHAVKKKHSLRIIALFVLVILVAAGVLLYKNLNGLLSDALLKSFDATPVADVYELKFENLRLNFWKGNIRVFNVSLVPREKPLNDYPYINSSFRLTTHEIELESVEIRTLLKLNKLVLKKILIVRPEILVTLAGEKHIMLPFRDSTSVVSAEKNGSKKSIAAFLLSEFELVDASFHVTNAGQQREYNIRNFNISVSDLAVGHQPGQYLTSFQKVKLAIGTFDGDVRRGAISHLAFKDFNIGVDSLAFQLSLDTLTYQFHDFNINLDDLDIQTDDSLFHIAMKSFDLSYQSKNIRVKQISFKPKVSHEVLQKKFRFQHTEFSGSVGTLELRQVNFDSILYGQKLFIDEIALDSVSASIFKDKTKPIDSARRPDYQGQTVSAIRMPIRIKRVNLTNVQLENTERKPDSTYAKVNISKGALELKNVTNLSAKEGLVMKADAYINGKVRFDATLNFSYQTPGFTFQGEVKKFDLPDLNSLIQSYTP
ncbi:MAG: hypothetical protein OEV74_07285, partial [Cyclobacteriaceae bacterium]|nr:hypothetical protein [Cyclobacteriaceae bacterium]